MSDGRRSNRGTPGNKGGRPKASRPLAKPISFRPYEDQVERFEEMGGVEYLRRLIDQDKGVVLPADDLIV